MAKKHPGICALCGKWDGDLTFEHIPPRSAFNATPAKPVSGIDILAHQTAGGGARMPWDTAGLQYTNLQKGMGRYCLCQTCNNNTSSWYGDAYVELARAAHYAIASYSPDDPDGIGFRDVYPLRFIKQVLSFFCSTNPPENPQLDDLRKFVLDKYAVGLDKTKYRLCMYFTKSTFMKQTGYMVQLRMTEEGYDTVTLSEITAYPFGFILYFDPKNSWGFKGTDITACADFGYDEKCNIELPWRIEEMKDLFPETFRSREEIIRNREIGMKQSED